MAARDRFGAYPHEPNVSSLQRYIQRACDPSNYEPNLALNLEIADLINQKKGNAPREAAVAIVNHINSRNPNVSLLALALLDICVKNCGYPFHLQISTKDFLNELVKRFPERPPIRPSRVQLKILEAIEEWRWTICETSRYKEDLGFIRDMHRLLSYKGYQFPEVRREDAAVLNPSDSLKSPEEMEEEERAAQSAKLQELIRRGTPADLQEANQLMKIMTGYDTRNKTDYRAEAAKELAKLKQKAKLLEEMLLKVKPGDTIGQQDAYSDLASSLKTAQPKIQKMVEEESDDTKAVEKLLELNDIINSTLDRYNLVKRGDLAAAAALPVHPSISPSPQAPSIPPRKQQEVSLIDFDDANRAETATTPSSSDTKPEDDLLGLSFGDSGSNSDVFGAGGGIALGFGANTSIPGPPLLSSTIQANTAGKQQITPSPSPVPTSSLLSRSTYNASQTASTPSSSNQSDPFALLGSRTPVSSSSLQQLQQTHKSTSQYQPQPPQKQNGSSDLDDWADFSSALPAADAPVLAANEVLLMSSNIQIIVEASRLQGVLDAPIVLRARFSNVGGEKIDELTFQMAVPKAFQLKMEPQSSRILPVGHKDAVTQIIRVTGVVQGQGGMLKVKWKVSYKMGGRMYEEQGVVESLPAS
ncbi:VHS domain-containing protein [Kalaharituber pfeilii]|nr:VHS domain-containing protein [Kalaharituber pfeilii]